MFYKKRGWWDGDTTVLKLVKVYVLQAELVTVRGGNCVLDLEQCSV